MSYRATPHSISGKSPTVLSFNREIRMKVPHVESNQTSQADVELRSRCHKYQERMKEYHEKKNNATLHNFKIGDIVFCANMKPAKLSLNITRLSMLSFSPRDTFALVNVATGTTFIRNAKYLKRTPTNEIEEVVDTSNDKQSNGSSSSSDSASRLNLVRPVTKVIIPTIKLLRIKAMSRLGQDV